MDKQIFDITKKILGILLIICLVTSITSMAVSAYDGMYDHDSVVQITQLEQINTFLHKGPVFVEMKAQSCKPCQQTKPILEKLAAEYKGKATIASIDIYQSPELAKYFDGYNLPDAFVIVGTKDGKYVYINDDGNSTLDRSQARIIGLNAGNKNRFERIIDRALIQQGKNKPMLTGQHNTGKYPSEQNQNVQYQGEQNQGRQNQGGQFPGELFLGEQYLGEKFTDGLFPGGLFPGEQYLDGQFSDIELFPGKHLGGKFSGGQNQGGQNQIKQFPIVARPVGARPVGARPAIGTGLVTPTTPGLITDPTYGVSAPATSGSKHSDEQQNYGKHSGEQHKGKKHSDKHTAIENT
jgi:thiol-disulfide isomerase/thioredoxin